MKDIQASTGKVATGRSMNFSDVAPEIVQLAINYASDYVDYMNNLPFDLQRHVTRLREVDKKCRDHVKEIEHLYDSFMKESASGNKARRSYLLQIRRLFGFCKELGDEKISIVQRISEVIESRNKQMEYQRKRFSYAYEPDTKLESDMKREKDKLDLRGNKRSRRQRNLTSSDNKDVSRCIKMYQKEQDKPSKSGSCEDVDEPPAKIVASSPNSDQSSLPIAVPALTRGALREEDKRLASRSKDKEETKQEKATEQGSNSNSGKSTSESASTVSSTHVTSASSSVSKNKSSISNSSSVKSNGKKKKKRKLTKHHSERHQSNNDDISMLDLPIDPDEPTYCLCQQVSFGQMIGCDNPKCPIEWFHFSCVRLTHKPKGKWYCPDCQLKRKRDCKRNDSR